MQAVAGIGGDAGPGMPDRILKPLKALEALRPIRPSVVEELLISHQFGAELLRLTATFLPEHLDDVRMKWKWDWLMTERFLQLVDEHLFPLDFDLINDYLFNSPTDEDEEIHPFQLVVDYILPAVYGLADETGMNEGAVWEMPGMWLLQELYLGGLSQEPYEDGMEWPDELRQMIERRAGVELAEERPGPDDVDARIAVAREAREPLCWLPGLVEQALGQTGNFFLDESWFNDRLFPGELVWCQRDVEMLTRSWALARPEVEKRKEFNEWCRQKEHIRELLGVLGIGYSVLDIGEGEDE